MANESILPAAPPKQLALKLSQIMTALQRLPKNGYNDFHKYHYVQEADVTDELRGIMAQTHIVLFSQVDSVSREADLTTAWMTFTLMDADSGETHVARWPGQGQDKNDKGIAKAITAATKYFLLKTFMLSAGDDPEQDTVPTDRPRSDSRPKAAKSTPTEAKTARPSLPKDPFAVRVVAGTLEPRKTRDGESQLFFRGQAVLESTQDTFGITAWRTNAQLLAHAQKQATLAVIQGQWHDRYPEFQVQSATWPPNTKPSDSSAATVTPADSASHPAAKPISDPPVPAEASEALAPEVKKALWDAAQQRHLDLSGLLAFASEQLGAPITHIADLPLAQVQALLSALQTHAPTSQAG